MNLVGDSIGRQLLSVKQSFESCDRPSWCVAPLFRRSGRPLSLCVCVYVCISVSMVKASLKSTKKGKREDVRRHCEGHRLDTVFSSGQFNSPLRLLTSTISLLFSFATSSPSNICRTLKLITGLPHSFLVFSYSSSYHRDYRHQPPTNRPFTVSLYFDISKERREQ